jgi:nucleoside triphosphate diphosphatase
MDDASARDAADEFLALVEVVRELRQRCPWDREQTLKSSARYLLEEAYEAIDAIEQGGDRELADELGDLTVQVLFAANIAQEEKRIAVASMLRQARAKLVRRHPHVYAGAAADSSAEVVRNWDKIKRAERSDGSAASAVDGVARAMPALQRAQKLGERARAAGMDWDGPGAVLDKVSEEVAEARAALERGDREGAADELGDAMLALANAPRFLGQDAEITLRGACDKFIGRFKAMEQIAAEQKVEITQLTPEEIEKLWQHAKQRVGSIAR